MFCMAVYVLSFLAVLLIKGALSTAAAPACSAAGISSAALAPKGGLNPADVLRAHSPHSLFFAALSDMAYVNDHGFIPSPRAPVWPCLQRWGARGSPAVTLDAPVKNLDPPTGIAHATLFRTDNDIFLLFRGLDNVANEEPISNNMNLEPAAAYFGLSEDEPKPSAIWVLQGFLRAHQAIEQLYLRAIDRLVAEVGSFSCSTMQHQLQ